MPAEAPFEAPSERRAREAGSAGIQTQVEEANLELHVEELVEQAAGLGPREDLGERIPRSVGVVREEELSIGQVTEAVRAKERRMPFEDVAALSRQPSDRVGRARHDEEAGERTPHGHDRHRVVDRVAVVDHDERRPARSEHPVELVHRSLGLREVMDDAVREDEVERSVREGKIGDRALDEFALPTLELEPPTGELESRLAEVEPGVARACAGEADSVGRDSAPRLEDIAAGPALEANHLRDVRLGRVAVALDLGEELRRAGLRAGEAKAGLMTAPEIGARCGAVRRAGARVDVPPTHAAIVVEPGGGSRRRCTLPSQGMCGICGLVGVEDERLVAEMTAALAHRGPDGEGIRVFPAREGAPPVALGHRRLAIIDPTPRGAQPMSYGNGRYWITYNGELYNFRELRSQLQRDGWSFSTECDTEVLLAMYERHGARMLDELNGIFAFAIWDEERAELFLARDRLGVKPLYYAERDGVLLFASEVKALLPALGTPTLRRDAVADYLTFLWVPDPDTMFEGVYKLPPGHYARYAGGRLSVREYWDVPFAVEHAPEAEWAERVRESVHGAVRRQMVSDVPLGSFLSGGVDSSAIVAEATAAAGRITTYTVGFSREDLRHEIVPDDLAYARQVGTRFGVDYHERVLAPDVVGLLPTLVWHMDEPVADPACITTYLICSAAREKLTVILSGMGGDEVFAGYPRYLAARIGRALEVFPPAARSALRRSIESRLTLGRPGRLRGPRRNLMKLVHAIDLSTAERHLAYTSYYRPDELRRVLSSDLRRELDGHDPFRRHREFLGRVAGEHWLNQLLYVDQKTYLPCLNLTYTDKMSMAASTEVRVPLLDDEVVELAGRVPPELKLRRLTRKYVFKKSMEPVLPKEVVWRPKAGFGAPVRSWLVGDLKPMVDELLSPERVRERGLFDAAEVERLVRANEEGKADNALRIWALLTLELWQQTFLDGARPGRHEVPLAFAASAARAR